MSLDDASLAEKIKDTQLKPSEFCQRLSSEIGLLGDFLKDEEAQDFTTYPFVHYKKSVIANYQSTLEKLGYNLADEVEKEIKHFKCYSNMAAITQMVERVCSKRFDEASLDDQVKIYDNILDRIMAQKYKFKPSSWSACGAPDESFECLKNALKKEGALSMMAYLGMESYSVPPKQSPSVGSYQVFSWPPGSLREDKEMITHRIVIVGAETIQTSKGHQNTILFLDPVDESKACDARKAYRVSYETLLKKTSNIDGVWMAYPILTAPSTRAQFPFYFKQPTAYCMDLEYKKELWEGFEKAGVQLRKP